MKMIHIAVLLVIFQELSALKHIPSKFLTQKSQISLENIYEKKKSGNGRYTEKRIFNSDIEFDSDFIENSDENQILNSGVEIINMDNNRNIELGTNQILKDQKMKKSLNDDQSLIQNFKSHNLREFNDNATIKHHVLEILHNEKGIIEFFYIDFFLILN